MAYKKKELEKLALEAIEKDDDILFVRDLVSQLPCSRATFYNQKLDKLDTISEALEKNRVNLCKELRKNWRNSENATLQTNLYKLIGSEEEAHRLNGSKQQTDVNISGNLDVNLQQAINKIYDGDGENSTSDG